MNDPEQKAAVIAVLQKVLEVAKNETTIDAAKRLMVELDG
jgi:hypothetical protein